MSVIIPFISIQTAWQTTGEPNWLSLSESGTSIIRENAVVSRVSHLLTNAHALRGGLVL